MRITSVTRWGLAVMLSLLMLIGCQANSASSLEGQERKTAEATKAFADFHSNVDPKYLGSLAGANLNVETRRKMFKVVNLTIVKDITNECSTEYATLMVPDREARLLYYQCIEYRLRLETLKCRRDYLTWLYAEDQVEGGR